MADATGEIIALCIGTAGLDRPDDKSEFQRAILGDPKILKVIGNATTEVVSDVEIIQFCEPAAQHRVCLISGTGSNCLGSSVGFPDVTIKAGGIDLPLSDWGSASGIGLTAMECVARARSGLIEWDDEVESQIYRHLNIETYYPARWSEIKSIAQDMRANKSKIASLARLVVAPYALKRGDQRCRAMLDSAADELASMVIAVARKLDVQMCTHNRDRGLDGAKRIDGVVEEGIALLCAGGVLENNSYVRENMATKVLREFPSTQVRVVHPEEGAAYRAIELSRR